MEEFIKAINPCILNPIIIKRKNDEEDNSEFFKDKSILLYKLN